MKPRYLILLLVIIGTSLCGCHLLRQSSIISSGTHLSSGPNQTVQEEDEVSSSDPRRAVQARDPNSPLAAGMREAEAAIKAGKLGYKRFGLRNGNIDIFKRILKEDYGITLYDVAGFSVSPYIRDNAEGYNLIMEEELYDRFGKDVIQEAQNKVKKFVMK